MDYKADTITVEYADDSDLTGGYIVFPPKDVGSLRLLIIDRAKPVLNAVEAHEVFVHPGRRREGCKQVLAPETPLKPG